MKILIEDGLSLQNKIGIGNFTLMIKKILEESGFEVYLAKIPEWIKSVKNITVRRIMHIIWLNSFFTVCLLVERQPLVLLCTSYQLPMIKVPGHKYISVIHDLTAQNHPEFFTPIQVIYSNFAVKNSLQVANCIVTVSKTIQELLVKQYNYPKNKVKIIYNRCNLNFLNISSENQQILRKYNISPKNYILSVASLNKRKNTLNLIKAFNLIRSKYPEIKLVLAGGSGNDTTLLSSIKNQNINTNNIIFTSYIDDNELAELYINALMYIFPSLDEGFGIPILEAQTAGIPLIVNDIPVFREIAGDGALFCSANYSEIAGGIEKIINDNCLRENLIKQGAENIKRYSTNIVKEQLLEVINAIS